MTNTNTQAFNKAHAEAQTNLYDAYLAQIKDEIEKHDELVSAFTKEYHHKIQPAQDEYNLSIKPEYDAAAAIVNPRTDRLKKRLERMKETYTKKVNDLLADFAKFKDKVLAEMEPLIADRKAQFEARIKPYEDEHKAKVDAAQAEFERLTRPAYDAYIKQARLLEDEFDHQMKMRATISGAELDALHAEYATNQEQTPD